MSDIDALHARLLQNDTDDIFPRIYDGFIEKEALAQGENSILDILSNAIFRIFKNRNLTTMEEEMIEQWEQGLGITPTAGQTLDDRRNAVLAVFRKVFVFNDKALGEKIDELAAGDVVYFHVNPQALTLEVWGDAQQGQPISISIIDGLRSIVPQNLQLWATEKGTQAGAPFTLSTGTTSAIFIATQGA